MTRTGQTGNPPLGQIVVQLYGQTDVGRTREHNEDAFMIADLSGADCSIERDVRTIPVGPRGTLFMVADGLGGAAAGEIASEMAISTVLEEMQRGWVESDEDDPELFAAALKAAAETANVRIHSYALEHPESRGMGTTATIAGLLADTLYLAQVGDSRGYLVRDGVARQITRDQSLMQRLIDAGELTPEEAEQSERRNIILQALGPEASVKVDLTYQKVRRGDILVLCTDGLSGLVSREEMTQVLVTEPDLGDACRVLIDKANGNGGPDNITVVAARFDGSGLGASELDDSVGHAVFPLAGATPQQPMPALEAHTGPSPKALFREIEITPERTPVVVPALPAGNGANRALTAALAAVIVLLAIFLALRAMRGPAANPTPHRGSAPSHQAP
ncbi:MAG: protein phosphatase 2C domain-containing protein [Gemmatimonadota bacterium]|nr:protein phosphatase 2C domain-containing protein [Gemmatimonadota bacterium]